ncbi:MAG: radical SAM protein [Nanoarchaeota archaeon]|nr:radical SAM protein [Nanoarchaeota archaeon]
MKTDYLYALENILPVKKLRRIILSVTPRCNSKCKTCSIWKNNSKDKLNINDFKKMANEPTFKSARFLVLTGGEPFLRNDIDKIINVFKKKNQKLHITILTNALLPETIYKKVKNMPRDVLITLSFNGMEKTHDETRGVKGNFKKLLKTIENLKKLKQNINLIYTITKENYNQLLWAWDFAKKHNLNLLFNPEIEYERLNTEKNRKLTEFQKKIVLEQLKKIYSQRNRWFFDYTYFLFFKKFYSNKRISNICYAGTTSLYIDYTGDIYPCENLVGRITPLGNIKKKFTIPKNYINKIKTMKCYENCFLLCEMVRNLRKHPIKTLIERNN